MNKGSSIETINRENLKDETKLRLSEISKTQKYFNSEINNRK